MEKNKKNNDSYEELELYLEQVKVRKTIKNSIMLYFLKLCKLEGVDRILCKFFQKYRNGKYSIFDHDQI